MKLFSGREKTDVSDSELLDSLYHHVRLPNYASLPKTTVKESLFQPEGLINIYKVLQLYL